MQWLNFVLTLLFILTDSIISLNSSRSSVPFLISVFGEKCGHLFLLSGNVLHIHSNNNNSSSFPSVSSSRSNTRCSLRIAIRSPAISIVSFCTYVLSAEFVSTHCDYMHVFRPIASFLCPSFSNRKQQQCCSQRLHHPAPLIVLILQ